MMSGEMRIANKVSQRAASFSSRERKTRKAPGHGTRGCTPVLGLVQDAEVGGQVHLTEKRTAPSSSSSVLPLSRPSQVTRNRSSPEIKCLHFSGDQIGESQGRRYVLAHPLTHRALHTPFRRIRLSLRGSRPCSSMIVWRQKRSWWRGAHANVRPTRTGNPGIGALAQTHM